MVPENPKSGLPPILLDVDFETSDESVSGSISPAQP